MSTLFQKSPKQVVSVEILHLDDLGYGPDGLHTRRDWRKECLTYLLSTKESFLSWQISIQAKPRYECQDDLQAVRASYKTTFDDGTTETVTGHPLGSNALDFVGHSFESSLLASKFEFLTLANFAGAKFKGAVFLDDAIWKAGCDFSGARFGQSVFFHKSVFSWLAIFTNTVFDKTANFNNVSFSGNALFSNATFFEQAQFFGAKFDDYTLFDDAAFVGATYFKEATFSEFVSFSRSNFCKDAYFTKAEFHGECHFGNVQVEVTNETIFTSQANFENAVFKNVGHFEQVRFLDFVPSFLGVDNTTTRLEFSDNYFPEYDRTEGAVNRLGHLKRLADEQGQTDQALNFNALELRAKAGLATTGSFTKFVTWIYGAVSDYGRSFTRPIATYVALLLITLLLATGHAAFSLPAEDCEGARWNVLSDLRRTTAPCSPATDDKLHLSGYRAAAEYTLYRAAGVLDFSDNDKSTDAVARRLFGQPIEPWWMRVWGVFKAIASTALLFLTALGLRNKYRIK